MAEEALTQFVLNTRLRDDQSALIYTLSRESAEHWHSLLVNIGVTAFEHHGDLTKASKDTNTAEFLATPAAWMVATSGFGTGFDDARLCLCIHLAGSHSIVQFGQEIGRLRCRGRRGIAITFTSNDMRDDGRASRSNFWHLVDDSGCHVVYIGKQLDGTSPLSCANSTRSTACDNCRQKLNDQGIKGPGIHVER
jgi:superfamily II DNA helicase RecQ